MIYNDFPAGHRPTVCAADTETITVIDGKIYSDTELLAFFAQRDHSGNILYEQSWAREHCTVTAYAWMLSDGKYFAICETMPEFLDFCALHRIVNIWWYNAPFDFSFFDYQLLTTGWKLGGKKLAMGEFNSLHGKQGQRYKISIKHFYRDKSRHKKPWQIDMYDFRNLFAGGLAQNLKAFDVRDFSGKPIRKLEMQYQSTDFTPERIAYMRNDTAGLYHLVRTASEFIEAELSPEYSFLSDKIKILTAGGLAKRCLLESMYQSGYKWNLIAFHAEHPMTPERDADIRFYKLYQGGKTLVNPRFVNKIYNGNIYYYDRNSMYPAEMAIMPDLTGGLLSIRPDKEDYYRDNNYQIIYEITDCNFYVKQGALPIFYDPFTRQYVNEYRSYNYNNRAFWIFDFELQEIAEFYNIDYAVNRIYAIKKTENPGIAAYVYHWYDQKAQAKKDKNGVLTAFAKLMLNASYGKLAQNPVIEQSHREIDAEGDYVHLIQDGAETDEKTILSVIMGAYITAKARYALTAFMRTLCGNACNTLAHIIYCDTDSVQTDIMYPDADPYTLGGWKLETGKPYNAGKWLAPKTYILLQFDAQDKPCYTIHSKGVNAKTLSAVIPDGTSPAEAFARFAPGLQYQSLCGINVSGGKALLPFFKQLCREDNTIPCGEYTFMEGD